MLDARENCDGNSRIRADWSSILNVSSEPKKMGIRYVQYVKWNVYSSPFPFVLRNLSELIGFQ